jgi:hypothetical protein
MSLTHQITALHMSVFVCLSLYIIPPPPPFLNYITCRGQWWLLNI